jgi:hypothetical protein
MSIRKKGATTWQIMIHMGQDETGKQIRQYHTFEGSKRDAQKKDALLQHARDTGTYVEPSKLTLSIYMERWLKDFARLTTSERTYQGYSDLVRLHVNPVLGTTLLSKLRPVQLQQFYADQQEHGHVEKPVEEGKEQPEPRGLSAQTVRNIHNVLHLALKTAVQWGLLAVNPADAVQPPNSSNTSRRR